MTSMMKKWIAAFSFLGFLGAAAYYSPYLGLDLGNRLACPLCPNVTVIGGALATRFIARTIEGGVLNALLFSFVGFVLLKIIYQGENSSYSSPNRLTEVLTRSSDLTDCDLPSWLCARDQYDTQSP
jgi:hypothetical protein